MSEDGLTGDGHERLGHTRPETRTGAGRDDDDADATGSGPFVFEAREWQAGNRAVYRRNPAYRPRPEPADGLAGGKVVKVERLEWLSMPDAATAAAAGATGTGTPGLEAIQRATVRWSWMRLSGLPIWSSMPASRKART